MTCDTFVDFVGDWLDGTMASAERAEADRHLEQCDACRALVADLRAIERATTTVERVALPPGAWERLERRLLADDAFAAARAADRRARGRSWRSWTWLAAAAVLVIAVGAGLYTSLRIATPTVAVNPTPAALVESVESELQLAATHYENAIAALEQVAAESDSSLDPEVTATLRANLQIIDKAIDDSRVALRVSPDDPLAQQSLFEAFRKKVSLLQDTVALMNEMRKGDTAAPPGFVGELKKS